MQHRVYLFSLSMAAGAGLLWAILEIPLLGEILQESSEESIFLPLMIAMILYAFALVNKKGSTSRTLLCIGSGLCCGASLVQTLRILPYRWPTKDLIAFHATEVIDVGSFNVLMTSKPNATTLAWLHALDVAILLEFNHDWDRATQDFFGLRRPSEGYFGIALLSKTPCLEEEEGEVAVDSEVDRNISTWQRCQLMLKGTLANIYAVHPSAPINFSNVRARRTYMQSLSRRLEEDPLPKIIAGDFNSVPWSENVHRFVNKHGLASIYDRFAARSTYPVKRYAPFLFGIPIDHILFSKPFRLLSMKKGSDMGSDHFPISVELEFRRF